MNKIILCITLLVIPFAAIATGSFSVIENNAWEDFVSGDTQYSSSDLGQVCRAIEKDADIDDGEESKCSKSIDQWKLKQIYSDKLDEDDVVVGMVFKVNFKSSTQMEESGKYTYKINCKVTVKSDTVAVVDDYFRLKPVPSEEAKWSVKSCKCKKSDGKKVEQTRH